LGCVESALTTSQRGGTPPLSIVLLPHFKDLSPPFTESLYVDLRNLHSFFYVVFTCRLPSPGGTPTSSLEDPLFFLVRPFLEETAEGTREGKNPTPLPRSPSSRKRTAFSYLSFPASLPLVLFVCFSPCKTPLFFLEPFPILRLCLSLFPSLVFGE